MLEEVKEITATNDYYMIQKVGQIVIQNRNKMNELTKSLNTLQGIVREKGE